MKIELIKIHTEGRMAWQWWAKQKTKLWRAGWVKQKRPLRTTRACGNGATTKQNHDTRTIIKCGQTPTKMLMRFRLADDQSKMNSTLHLQ